MNVKAKKRIGQLDQYWGQKNWRLCQVEKEMKGMAYNGEGAAPFLFHFHFHPYLQKDIPDNDNKEQKDL
jgi:hypothetical protein